MIYRRSLCSLLLCLQAACCLAAEIAVALRPDMPAIEHPDAAPLWTTDVQDASREDPDLKLDSARPFHWVFESAEEILLHASISTPDKGDQALLTIWDWHNRAVRQIEWPAPSAHDLRFQVQGRGTWLLTFDRRKGEQTVSRLARSFTVCPPNNGLIRGWDVNRFFIGACSFPSRQHWQSEYGTVHPEGLTPRESAEMDADLTARLGVQVVRFDAGHEDEHQWSVDMYEWRDIRPFLKITSPPGEVMEKYRHVTDPKWRYPHPEKDVRQHFHHLAELYGQRALFFELYNEQDWKDFWRGTPQEYVQHMKWLGEEFSGRAPDAVLAAGGYTLLMPERFDYYVRALKGYVDWVTYHTHGPLLQCVERWQKLKRAHEQAGYIAPVYVNSEMGSAAWRLDREMQQAYVALQKILYFWAHDNRGVVMFDSRSIQGVRVGKNEPGKADWGYVDHFFCPRFKYGAVAGLIEHFDGITSARTLEDGPNRFIFEFGDDANRRIITAFRPTRDTPATAVTVTSDAASAERLDPMGNATPVAEPKRVQLTADLYPAVLILKGASEVKVE